MDHFKTFFKSLPRLNVTTYDVGNTNPHRALFHEGELVNVKPVNPLDLMNNPKDLNSIICSVNKEISSSEPFKSFNGNSFLNLPVHYSKSLGHDRLSLAHFIFNVFPQEDVIIIDAGTFITVDFVNAKGFQGGHIIPGIKTLASSFQKGQQLFSANTDKEIALAKDWPKNTDDALNGGLSLLVYGLAKEIQNLCSNGAKIVLTGGQRTFLKDFLEPSLEEDHLLHYALYFQYVNHSSHA